MSDPLLKNYEPPKRFIPKKRFVEDGLQRQVCRYLDLQFPNVIYRSDLDSGRNKQSNFERHRMRAMQSSRSWPDLFIYEPRVISNKEGSTHYCGLALELKAEGTTVILKIGPRKGHLSSDQHIQEQAVMLKELVAKGYYANFAVGFDEAVRIINWYLGKKQPKNGELF